MPTTPADLLPNHFRDMLREQGLRATPARVRVLEVLSTAQSPLSHAEVSVELESLGVDPATVFRNLNTLTENGLLRRLDAGDHVWRFEAVTPSKGEARNLHPHFLCTACGEVSCMPTVKLKFGRGVEVPDAVRSRSVEVQVKGLCDRCL